MKTPIIDAARLVGKLDSLGLHGLANSVEKADKIGKEKWSDSYDDYLAGELAVIFNCSIDETVNLKNLYL